jgi:ubiquinone/menaquinone biosynthesis C-methylase UbiE
MSDLGKPVITAWRRQLREAGWAGHCSLMVFDARRMPFRSESISVVSSVGGMQNIKGDRSAYQEAARVLRPSGRLLDYMILFEEGGLSQRELSTVQATSTWNEYESLLSELQLTVERWDVVSSRRGKANPEDVYPKNNETWEMRMVLAAKNS